MFPIKRLKRRIYVTSVRRAFGGNNPEALRPLRGVEPMPPGSEGAGREAVFLELEEGRALGEAVGRSGGPEGCSRRETLGLSS